MRLLGDLLSSVFIDVSGEMPGPYGRKTKSKSFSIKENNNHRGSGARL